MSRTTTKNVNFMRKTKHTKNGMTWKQSINLKSQCTQLFLAYEFLLNVKNNNNFFIPAEQ
jgi:hypothetical protein